MESDPPKRGGSGIFQTLTGDSGLKRQTRVEDHSANTIQHHAGIPIGMFVTISIFLHFCFLKTEHEVKPRPPIGYCATDVMIMLIIIQK